MCEEEEEKSFESLPVTYFFVFPGARPPACTIHPLMAPFFFGGGDP